MSCCQRAGKERGNEGRSVDGDARGRTGGAEAPLSSWCSAQPPLIACCSLCAPGVAPSSWHCQGATHSSAWPLQVGNTGCGAVSAPLQLLLHHPAPWHTVPRRAAAHLTAPCPWWALPHLTVQPHVLLYHPVPRSSVPPRCPASHRATRCHPSPSLVTSALSQCSHALGVPVAHGCCTLRLLLLCQSSPALPAFQYPN